MKINSLLLTSFLYAAQNAFADVAHYGGCLNRTAYEEGALHKPVPFEETGDGAYHCHYDSSYCIEGEDFVTPVEAAELGLPKCTCDTDYNNNVYAHACYDSGTHRVTCSADVDGCKKENLYPMGNRMNNQYGVPDDCGHGSEGSGGGYTPGATHHCGKTCTCNFVYAQGAPVTAFSTTFGACANLGEAYCATMSTTCEEGDAWFGAHHPFHPMTSDGVNSCTCDQVHTGACIKQKNKGFRYCAVSGDSCKEGLQFISAQKLQASSLYKETCTLCTQNCYNKWDFEYNGKKGICKRITKREGVRDNLCKIDEVAENCPSACGVCCGDNPTFKFSKNPKDTETPMVKCSYLNNLKRKNKFCKRGNVKTYCAKKCDSCSKPL